MPDHYVFRMLYSQGVALESVMARFATSALEHRTRQIAMDGSQKLPQRLLAPLSAVRDQAGSFAAIALALAAWVRWQAGATDTGERFAIDDPAAQALADALRDAGTTRARAAAALAVLGPVHDEVALDAVAAHLSHLETSGARAVLTAFLGENA